MLEIFRMYHYSGNSLFQKNGKQEAISSWLQTLIFIVLVASQSNCYSFSQGAIPPHIRTVMIPVATDLETRSIPLLKENLTQETIDQIQKLTRLSVVQRPDSDARLDIVINSVTDLPGELDPVTERAVTNRIQIKIKATFKDNLKNVEIYSKNISNQRDYTVGDLDDREDTIMKVIEILAQTMTNEMSSNW